MFIVMISGKGSCDEEMCRLDDLNTLDVITKGTPVTLFPDRRSARNAIRRTLRVCTASFRIHPAEVAK